MLPCDGHDDDTMGHEAGDARGVLRWWLQGGDEGAGNFVKSLQLGEEMEMDDGLGDHVQVPFDGLPRSMGWMAPLRMKAREDKWVTPSAATVVFRDLRSNVTQLTDAHPVSMCRHADHPGASLGPKAA